MNSFFILWKWKKVRVGSTLLYKFICSSHQHSRCDHWSWLMELMVWISYCVVRVSNCGQDNVAAALVCMWWAKLNIIFVFSIYEFVPSLTNWRGFEEIAQMSILIFFYFLFWCYAMSSISWSCSFLERYTVDLVEILEPSTPFAQIGSRFQGACWKIISNLEFASQSDFPWRRHADINTIDSSTCISIWKKWNYCRNICRL